MMQLKECIVVKVSFHVEKDQFSNIEKYNLTRVKVISEPRCEKISLCIFRPSAVTAQLICILICKYFK